MIELLRNAELYDPEPRGRRNLLVAGERIVWVGAELPSLDREPGCSGDRPRRPPRHSRTDRRARSPDGWRWRGRPEHPSPAGDVEPAHCRRSHDGDRRARHRRRGADSGRAGDGGARADRRGIERVVLYRRLPCAASHRDGQRPLRPGTHRSDPGRRRSGGERSSVEPADTGRAAPHRGRCARGRPHDREGRHRPRAHGRRPARTRTACATRSTAASSPPGCSIRPT